MDVIIPPKRLAVRATYDVIVAGGGPAGLGAVVAAARAGASVLLLEKRGFLGGNISACFVETASHMLNRIQFPLRGLYAEMCTRYGEMFASDDLRAAIPNDYAAFRFHSEYFKIFCDRWLAQERVTVKLHAFVNDVVTGGGRIQAVIVQSKLGPIAYGASVFVDATGDGDVACAAKAPYDQGSDLAEFKGKNQAATLNMRVTGADIEAIQSLPEGINSISRSLSAIIAQAPHESPVERDWVALGRLTAAGQISYVNSADVYGVDPVDIDDVTRGEIEAREKALKLYYFIRDRGAGCRKLEIASFAQEIGFRDSRRIRCQYTLTKDDIESRRHFDDVIAIFPRFYDMTSLTGNFDKSRGFDGPSIYIRVTDPAPYHIPYRSLVPLTIGNLLIAGRCLSADHIAESSIRAIYVCMSTGQAAGAAAAIAAKNSCAVADINIGLLHKMLAAQGAVFS